MNTITLILNNRPTYSADVIEALVSALVSAEEFFDLLIFSIEPGNPDVAKVALKASEVLCKHNVIQSVIWEPEIKLGVGTHHECAMTLAFEHFNADFNLLIEDDALLRPDAIKLAAWFHQNYGEFDSPYLFLAMCHHELFGRGQNPGGVPDDHRYMFECAHIPSPFAWATNKYQWPFIKSFWNFKKLNPSGWDFSLSMAMALTGKKGLHPALSRCKNIGRLGGTHESPDSFDATQSGLVYADEYDGHYMVAGRFTDSDLFILQPWMRDEFWSMFERAT